ncbi:MAG: hypothetical protein R3C11_25750 [Planctomycetaceae bacterium]
MVVKQQTISLFEHSWLTLISLIALGQFCQVEATIYSPWYLLCCFMVQMLLLGGGVYYFRRVNLRFEGQPALLPVILLTGLLSLLVEPFMRLHQEADRQ